MPCRHHALSIPEIVCRIFEKLGPCYPEQRPKSFIGSLNFSGAYWGEKLVTSETNRIALARAARCCKDFSSAALDVLWRDQTSLVPLLSIFDSFGYHSTGYALHDTINASDLERFKMYSRRVRTLEVRGAEQIEDFVFIHIAQLLKGTPLMPLLQVLTYGMSAPLSLLLTSHLHHVHILARAPAQGGAIILRSLLQKAPRLERFVSLEEAVFPPTAWDTLSKFHNLRDLSIGSSDHMDLDGLKTILRMPLSGLSLILSQSPLRLPSIDSCPHILKELILSAQGPLISDILNCLFGTPLQSLRIRYLLTSEDAISEHNWVIRLSTISHWFESLSFLELYVDLHEPTDRIARGLTVLEPLLRIRSMKTFIFLTPITLELFDDDFQRISQAWPMLETLRFDIWGPMLSPPATFATLVSLAVNCPNLSNLAIRLDVALLPPAPYVSNHKLRLLNIDYFLMHDPFEVARYLDALFPFLTSIVGAEREIFDDEDDRERTWDNVDRAVRICRATRMDQEQRFRISQMNHEMTG